MHFRNRGNISKFGVLNKYARIFMTIYNEEKIADKDLPPSSNTLEQKSVDLFLIRNIV